MKTCAIIGNRYNVPHENLQFLEDIGYYLGQIGYTLNSGGALGCDQAGERGFDRGGFPKVIRKAKDATPEAIALASQFHEAWHVCSPYVRQLHGRNSMIILGDDLNVPVDFVLCHASSEIKGGTALGIKIARDNKIPVFNLFKKNHGFDEFLQGLVNESRQTEEAGKA